MGLDINTLRILCNKSKIKWTLHALKRIRERGISSDDVIKCIMTGEIIRLYENDKPLPSCLIHATIGSRHIHVAVSSDGQYLYLITTYYPNKIEWEDDFKTRREIK